MKPLKTLAVTVLLVLFASFANTASAQGKAEFKIINHSVWTIDYIYFSSVDDSYWGDDKLGSYVLEPNYEYTMYLSEGCGDYDVKIVDEDGDECIVYSIFLCNEEWEIYDEDLLDCQGY